ncbi:MAG: DegQ family serine endoprotease [Gammaproteobacteria bacterium]|nr:DegQ family serine endoprotease [Gammaproteobacteria bacterium]
MSGIVIRGLPRALAVLLLCTLLTTQAWAQAGLPDFTGLVKEASPAVVNISTTQKVAAGRHPGLPEGLEIPDMPEGPLGDLFRHFFGEGGPGGAPGAPGNGPLEREARSLGSGLIVSADGYILTNNHVVKDAEEIIVRLSDRRELIAEVVGLDERSDVAVLKIDANNLPVARIGKSEDLEVGSWVLAIGSPFGFDYSATAGIVSAKGRSLPRENYVPFIQTDVAINPGNSGGPLYNLDGEVVGVNSQIYSRTGGFMGLSFAIPIEVAMEVAQQLKESGRVSRGWLGVIIQDVTRDLAESFGMKRPMGALVSRVLPESPAEASGLRVGDVILEFNSREVVSSTDLPPIVGRTPVGEKVPVLVMRDGKQTRLRVELGELPEDDVQVASSQPAKPTKTSRLGISVSDLTDRQRKEMELDQEGVLVEQVERGAAAEAGIRQGDVILRINNEPVKSAGDFEQMAKDLPAGRTVPVLVQRRGGPTFLALKVPAKE